MIKYIYTGQEPDRISDLAAELLAAADKVHISLYHYISSFNLPSIVVYTLAMIIYDDVYRRLFLKKISSNCY